MNYFVNKYCYIKIILYICKVNKAQNKNINDMKTENNIKEIEINDRVFLYNDGKHIVDSFTKTAIRFICVSTNKIQTINKNTFLKKHAYSNGCWFLIRKIRTTNMDFI